MGILEDTRELRSRAADRLALERAGATAHDVGTVSRYFVRAIHPGHGQPVLYTPGEMLPQWAATALDGGRGHYDADAGVFTLDAK